MSETSLLQTLLKLESSKAEFIVVGGLAAVLSGAPIQTYDIDIVYSQTPENIERLMPVLLSLDAIFRIQPERKLRPAISHLSGSGHLNLLTSGGPLDLLAAIGAGLGYNDLIHDTYHVEIAPEVHIRVLRLEKLIALKEELAGEKDRAVLPILRQTLKELKKGHEG